MSQSIKLKLPMWLSIVPCRGVDYSNRLTKLRDLDKVHVSVQLGPTVCHGSFNISFTSSQINFRLCYKCARVWYYKHLEYHFKMLIDR